jgi:hypothetical protein
MRFVLAMFVMIVMIVMIGPVHAERLAGTWRGPQTIHLLHNGTWICESRHGGWWHDRKTLSLQIHMPPMFSYRPPPVPCQYDLAKDRLVISDCNYAGEYKR